MPTPHASVLYLGPLRPETLTLLTEAAAGHALFITPSPESEQWQALQQALPTATQQVTKLAQTSGELPYYEFNLPEFNASQPATGLYTLYPGLELLESKPQPLTSVEVLLSKLELQDIDTLVVEQPELVWPSLQVLADNPRYQHINQLWLRVGAVPLYQNMPEIADILSWCQEHGFELQASNEEDPDLPLLQLTRHPYYYRWQEEVARRAKLAKQLKTAQQEAETQQAHYAQVKAQSEQAQAQREKEYAQREKEHQQRLDESAAQQQQQVDEYQQLQQKYKKLQQQLAEQEAKAATLQAALEKQQNVEAKLTKLQKTLDTKFEEQHIYLQKTVNALGQHITRCTQDQ